METRLKRIAARLPSSWQQELRRLLLRWQMRGGDFAADEPEYDLLAAWVRAGDWVIDVGANVGHYTARLSELVGSRGRVIALEPVPATFDLLASNVGRFAHPNVTLLNVAASDRAAMAGMAVPLLSSGLENRYMAHLSPNAHDVEVFCLPIDALGLPHRVSLVKVDAEGHEPAALSGMAELIRRDRPMFIVEDNAPEIGAILGSFGYVAEKLPGSPNRVYRPSGGPPEA